MKKKIVSLLIVLALALALMPSALAASSLSNFSSHRTYKEGQFKDVPRDEWYYASVASAYELGLVNGDSPTAYNPNGSVTLAETLALASRLHSIYYGGTGVFEQDDACWYQVYVDYAVAQNIIVRGQYADYDVAATRAQFAVIMAAALPTDALQAKNTVSQIPDVQESASYGPAVYKLYRAGVLAGNDDYGTFSPNSNIKRSEVAAVVTRMALPAQRKDVDLKVAYNAEQIYALCSPAVFYIEVFDGKGVILGTGSGFFINANGAAVTNYHVIDGASSAKITVSDTGKVYDVAGVYDYSVAGDWAVIKINGSGFKKLDINESAVAGGQTVFAIGSPMGLQSTISQGLVSNPSQLIDGTRYIQTSAAISSGSSGGALINTSGEVVGITTAGITEGSNLGFALPISVIKGYATASVTPLADVEKEIYGDGAYDYLRQLANNAGEYDSSFNSMSYYIGSYYDDDADYYYYVDWKNESLAIDCIAVPYDYPDDEYFFVIYVPSDLAAPYTGAVIYTAADGSEIRGYCNVYPASFNQNSRVSFYSYDGPSDLRSDFEDVFVSEICYAIHVVDTDLLADVGYSVTELGFKSIG